MHNAVLMHIGNGLCNAFDDGRRLNIRKILRIFLIMLDYVRELWMTKEFHTHVQLAFELDQMAYFDNIIMVQLT